MAGKNYIENVAIVGGSGQVGSYFVAELLKTGKHKVTVVTRKGGSSAFQDGVHVAEVDYNDHSSLVTALKGQDFLIITMNNVAPPDTQFKLVDAAGEAGVPFVMPNWYGVDVTNKKLGADIFLGRANDKVTSHVESVGKSAWIVLCNGFWYEFSLCGDKLRYGFDIKNREVTFYDEGTSKQNTSTWVQTGRAIAALVSLKISPEGPDDKSPTLSQYRNSGVYVSSFHVSQKDMFESLKRVTGTSDRDWKITSKPSAELYAEGVKLLQSGNRNGFVQLLYTRVSSSTGEGSFDSKLDNEALGLPVEDLDESTKRGLEIFKEIY